MKTPEEIKKGLALCSNGNMRECMQCPYPIGFECFEQPMKDALAYIQKLESRLAQVERERDALLNDLQTAIYRGRAFNLDCEFCKDKDKPVCDDCEWEWRGVCAQNTEEDEHHG